MSEMLGIAEVEDAQIIADGLNFTNLLFFRRRRPTIRRKERRSPRMSQRRKRRKKRRRRLLILRRSSRRVSRFHVGNIYFFTNCGISRN